MLSSRVREQKIIRWLDSIESRAAGIFLMGDIFDFWFEYRRAIPKGFTRLQGKIAALTDQGIPVIFFTGNHDMWMFDYFPEEIGVTIFHNPQVLEVNGKRFFIGHGDGLGPGDRSYKFLKKIFRSRWAQWLFARIHPNLGMFIAQKWSKSSRISKMGKEEFKGEEEFLVQFCKTNEQKDHFDYYIFGHRHLPLDIPINENSRYLNLGEWVNYSPYVAFDGHECTLLTFE